MCEKKQDQVRAVNDEALQSVSGGVGDSVSYGDVFSGDSGTVYTPEERTRACPGCGSMITTSVPGGGSDVLCVICSNCGTVVEFPM